MNDSINERSSISSDIGDVEIANDDIELEDQRFRFIFNYLSIAYSITPIIFKKGGFSVPRSFKLKKVIFFLFFSAILNNEAHRKIIDSFFDKSDRNIILIFENSDSLNILTEFPIQFKSKIICFVKRNEAIIENNVPLKKQIAIAEFTPSSITQLSLFISEVLQYI